MRYVYLKNGDAIEQVRRIDGAGSNGGPDAFLADFLQSHSEDEVLLLCKAQRYERLSRGRLCVESYPAGRGLVGHILASLRIGMRMLRWKPDRILCGCGRELLWISVLAAKLRRIPIVCSRHTGISNRKGIRRLVHALNRASIHACKAVVCHGPYLKAQMIELGVRESRVHEFDVDLRSFAAHSTSPPEPQALRAFKARFAAVILFLGRIELDKGVCDLLDAFAALVGSRNSAVGLVYVGQGKDLPELESRVRDRRLDESVLLLGKIPHAALPQIIRCATVVVTPTRLPLVEGRCMVALESLVMGVPVVAPAYAAFPYVIQDGVNGLLFDVGNVAALQARLSQLLSDASLRGRLEKGAAETARQLLRAGQGFSDAVERAFRSVS